MELAIIVAVANDRAIGRGNQLLWHISEDLKRFKRITMGSPVVMGRKTYESIGRPLPGRRNIVISRNNDLRIEGCEVYGSVGEALESCCNDKKVFVIGGGEIYKQTIPLAEYLYLTVVHHTYEADTYFPEIDVMCWQEEEFEHYERGEKFEYPYSFIDYKRVK